MIGPNPDAMLLVMLAGDPASIGMEACSTSSDRYERLFDIRDRLITAKRDDDSVAQREIADEALALLEDEFSEQVEQQDIARVAEIISGLYANPREIDDLTENQIAVIEDTAVNVGFVRTMTCSYDIDLFADPRWLMFAVRYRRFMV